ncbi:MAG TPA: hypothetical protein PKA58_28215 [Polyangium sp.]|nr:hypothetical protein [Polyangium sp.]
MSRSSSLHVGFGEMGGSSTGTHAVVIPPVVLDEPVPDEPDELPPVDVELCSSMITSFAQPTITATPPTSPRTSFFMG